MQTDPAQRTTVERLLRDPWVMKDSITRISWESKIEVIAISSNSIINFYLNSA